MTFKRSGISKMDNLDLLIGEDVTNMFILKRVSYYYLFDFILSFFTKIY